MSDIIIRHATIFDLEQLVPLFDAYRQFYGKPSDPELARQFLRDRLQHGQSIVILAATPDGAAIGFTQLFPSFSSASAARIFILNDLFIREDQRRNGVGRRLLEAATAFGRAAGAVRLTLSTEIANQAAQALYESEGWQRQTDFYVYNLTC